MGTVKWNKRVPFLSVHLFHSLFTSHPLSLHDLAFFSVIFDDEDEGIAYRRIESGVEAGQKNKVSLVSRTRLHLVCWELGGDSASLVFSGLGAAVDVCTMFCEDLECIPWDGSCRDTKQNGGIWSQSKDRELAANPQIDPHPLLTVQHGTSSPRQRASSKALFGIAVREPPSTHAEWPLDLNRSG